MNIDLNRLVGIRLASTADLLRFARNRTPGARYISEDNLSSLDPHAIHFLREVGDSSAPGFLTIQSVLELAGYQFLPMRFDLKPEEFHSLPYAVRVAESLEDEDGFRI